MLTKHLQMFQRRRHAQNEILFREVQCLYVFVIFRSTAASDSDAFSRMRDAQGDPEGCLLYR